MLMFQTGSPLGVLLDADELLLAEDELEVILEDCCGCAQPDKIKARAATIIVKLCLSKAQNSDGTFRISWQPFELLFRYKKGALRQSYNDIQKTGEQPKEIELIDQIFN